ncbi:hypothetical protein F5Y17DRAFT_89819 [Xylariaceae sp. FL0594]|nr:hypothetical protein F5Y17DRAFT_89819 [Xylariaceae sp. FL0594]
MPPKKRGSIGAEMPESSSTRRRSTRLSSTFTAKKSSYFESQDSEDDDVDDLAGGAQPRHKTTSRSKNATKATSGTDDDDDQYEEDEVTDDEIGDSDAEEDDDDGDDSETPPPKTKKASSTPKGTGKRGRPPKASSQVLVSSSSKSKAKSSSTPATTPTPTKKKRGRPAKSTPTPNAKRRKVADLEEGNDDGDDGNQYKDGEDDDEDDEDEDEDEDDEPRVTLIPLPQLRDTNGVEYEKTRLHPNTLHFLGDLKKNNKRSWLKMHDPEYRRSLKDWESFVETLTDKIIEADETIPELPLKDVIFRIYRDIRFSKDPTPYKPHYSAAWSRTGRKGPYACYYVHVEPGHCFVGGGLWQPEAPALAKLRASVDERPHRIRRVLTDPAFVRTFLPDALAGKGKKGKGKNEEERRILKAFADKNKENALKTKPKGFNPEHRDIQLLKLRNYTVGRQIPDEDLYADDAQERIVEVIRAMVPFVTFLNSVVMPDPGVDSDSEEEEEEEGENEGDD